MKFQVSPLLLVVEEHERSEASGVALQALFKYFACPATTFLTFWKLSLRFGPELRHLPEAGSDCIEAMEWTRATLAAQAALRESFPGRPNRMLLREREQALAQERVVLDLMTDEGTRIAHPLDGWPPEFHHPMPRQVTRRRR